MVGSLVVSDPSCTLTVVGWGDLLVERGKTMKLRPGFTKGKPGEGWVTPNGRTELLMDLDIMRGGTPVRNRTAEERAAKAQQPKSGKKAAPRKRATPKK